MSKRKVTFPDTEEELAIHRNISIGKDTLKWSDFRSSTTNRN